MNNMILDVLNNKTKRKYHVLAHIVNQYVQTSFPVSSKNVAELMNGSVSSATVRNIMAQLEEEGFITHPHTSAGRIPTNVGYRSYVDVIKKQAQVEKQEAERLANEYSQRIRTMEEVIEKTSFLLSHELHNAGFVVWPSISDFYLKHMELVRIKAETCLAVLVTMTNAVKKYIVKLDRDVEEAQLKKISNFINANYEQEPFSDIFTDLKDVLENDPNEAGSEIIKIAGSALKIIDSIVDENIENEIYWQGLDFFMEESSAQDISLTKKILQVFTNRNALVRLIKKELPNKGLKVYISDKDVSEILDGCSMVTSGYTMRGRTVGRIGIVGPTRMDYRRALATVGYLSELISCKLEELNS